MEIIPAILTDSIEELKEKISLAEGKFQRVQIDVVDARFVDNKTIFPDSMKFIETNLKLDFHLMVGEPVNWVEKCAVGGADRIIAQIEMMTSQTEFIKKVGELGREVGLAIDLDTSILQMDKSLLGSLNVILLMGVKAGFGGQKFDMKVLEKVSDLHKNRIENNYRFKICVDGGVDFDNAEKVMKNGCDEVAVGTSLFKGDILKNKQKFEEILIK